MDASVIVVNWRKPELTLRCLASLAAQRTERSFEVVLVENEASPGSTDPFREKYPDVAFVENERNLGFAAGVASGVRVSTGDVLILLNNDAVADEAFVDALLARLRAEPAEVAAVAAAVELQGRYRPADDGRPADLTSHVGAVWRRVTESDPGAVALMNSTGITVLHGGNGADRDWLVPTDRLRRSGDDEPFGFSGGAAALRRTVWDAVGGFDDSFFMYYEDFDLSWRMRLSGFRIVFEPTARVTHEHAGSSGHSSALLRFHSLRNRLLTTLRNGTVRLLLLVSARTAGRALRDALAVIRSRPADAYLGGAEWWRLVRDVVALAPRVVRTRGAASPAMRSRRRPVQRRFWPS
ncbi:glycosyltransferase family 2 protein [Planctomonas psychrotolerans]|uniref:glycosyltransferase family 2 protein n=1 Tax=Planctomonas psychrotolerans TaxID=2528712 RepID=UPI00123BFFFD|nr:glycosyltransferase family 2 protein [Planctomonas psychrotolerans]